MTAAANPWLNFCETRRPQLALLRCSAEGLSGIRSCENRAREGSAYRGKAAIFCIMESTMTYRGFLRSGRSALV